MTAIQNRTDPQSYLTPRLVRGGDAGGRRSMRKVDPVSNVAPKRALKKFCVSTHARHEPFPQMVCSL